MRTCKHPLRRTALLMVVACLPTTPSLSAPLGRRRSKPRPALIRSSMEGQTDEVRRLLGQGVDVNARDKHQATALHYADSREVAELLLRRGARVDDTARDGVTPLHMAVGSLRVQVAQFLLEHDADLEARTSDGSTPLHWALGEMIPLLLDAGADPKAKDERGWTPLMYHFPATRSLVDLTALVKGGADLEARDQDGNTALILAVESLLVKSDAWGLSHRQSLPRTLVIKHLIRLGSDVNARNNEYQSALAVALERGDLRAASILEEAGADDIGLVNPRLFAAVRSRSIEDVRAAIENGADVNAIDRRGRPLLCMSVGYRQAPILKLLLRAGADPRCTTPCGVTPLMSTGSYRIAKMLIEAGADPQRRSKSGRTALHSAAYGGNARLVRLLHSAGADPNVLTDEGVSPLMIAAGGLIPRACGRPPPVPGVVRALLDAGAYPNLTGNRFRRPLTEAPYRSGHREVVAILRAAGAR